MKNDRVWVSNYGSSSGFDDPTGTGSKRKYS